MASLPPYSTFRTDSKQMMFPQATSHGNILTFTPPGFKQSLNVKFPDSRLPVCEKCKKNFKTKEMCRVRNGHTSPPWTTAYICLTLDDSCTDADGKYVDKPLTVRMVQWQPYCVKDAFSVKTPVCSACKKTNRTRAFCRDRHKHRQLPWCTVYVLLSALETADPATIVAAPSKLLDDSEKKDDEKSDGGAAAKEEPKTSPVPSPTNTETDTKASETSGAESPATIPPQPAEGEGDDINDIPESRTFLAKVSCESISIHWLELSDIEGNDGGMPVIHQHADPVMYGMGPGGGGMPMPPEGHAQYYHHSMYAAQHQQALKSQQQYFFQMQRHPNQYAPWPPHYNQHPHMMHGPGGMPPPPPPNEGSPLPPRVSAGEAAAQQQKRNREATDDRGSPMHPPPTHHHGHPPGPHGQPQNWMLYQQMYQAQLPPMGHPAQYPPPPGARHMPPPEGGPPGPMMAGNEAPYNRPPSPNGKEIHEEEPKRQRLA